jgi:hypothetical protein
MTVELGLRAFARLRAGMGNALCQCILVELKY